MKLMSYSPFDDTGGLGWNLATAFGRERPDIGFRQVCGAPSYLHFPSRDPWRWRDIVRWWDEADAVHVHDGFHNMPSQRRGIVVTWHGTGFREASSALLMQQAAHQAIGTVSTLDLWLLAPDDVVWMPAPHDLDAYAALVPPERVPGPIRVGHAPTNRALKHTEMFLAACEKLGDLVEVVLIEGTSWQECLARKATCDIWYDQVALGYGGNAIEAWGMGMPVIAGAPDATLAEYDRRFGALPFLLTDAWQIGAAVEWLATDAEVRARVAHSGREHAARFHSFAACVELMLPLYEAAAG